jgi:hypothetical protein
MEKLKKGLLAVASLAAVFGAVAGGISLFGGGSSQPAPQAPSSISASAIKHDVQAIERSGNLPHGTTLPQSFSGATAIVTIGGSQLAPASKVCPSQVFTYKGVTYLFHTPEAGTEQPGKPDTTYYVAPGSSTQGLVKQFGAAGASGTGERFLAVVATAGNVKGFLKQASGCGLNVPRTALVIVAGGPA